MLDGIADCYAESEKKDLSDCEKRRAKDNVADGPSVVESAEDENQLRDDIDHSTDQRPQDVDNPKANWVRETESCKAFECGDGYEKRDTKSE
jgi:hypothetical protein